MIDWRLMIDGLESIAEDPSIVGMSRVEAIRGERIEGDTQVQILLSRSDAAEEAPHAVKD